MPSNFIIEKKKAGSELTNGAIADLKTRINELNAVYNIIIKHVCAKKRFSAHDYIGKITAEVSSLYSDYLDRFCIVDKTVPVGAPAGTAPSKCSNPMFDPAKLASLAQSLYMNPFFNKACRYKHHITGNFEPNVQIAGSVQIGSSYGNLLDIGQLLKETSTEPLNSTYVCFQKDSELVCAEMSNNRKKKCTFCDKWTEDRNLFRRIMKELLGTTDSQVGLYLMEQSLNLLPSAILTQTQYNDFFSALEQYKKSRE